MLKMKKFNLEKKKRSNSSNMINNMINNNLKGVMGYSFYIYDFLF